MLDLEKVYEALAYWRGNLNASEFALAVGRTRQHVQREVISPFVQDRSDLRQERGRKHGRTLLARPKSAPNDLWAFFNLLAVECVWRRRKRSDFLSIAGFEIVDLTPPASANISVWMCRAAGQKCALLGNYLFKNHGVRAVRFSPHTMVRTPRRIHFRGHLLVHTSDKIENWGYVDLVPGRFLDDDNLRLDKSSYKDARDDQDWHEKVRIAFEINPALPQHVYSALQQEHGLMSGQEGRCRFEFTVSKALVYSYEHHIFDRTIGPERMKAWVRCCDTAAGFPDLTG